MSDWLIKGLEGLLKLISYLKPSLRVEVKRLSYQLISNEPGTSVVVVTPHPSRYYAEVQLVNTSNSAVFIQDIRLVINEDRVLQPTEKVLGVRLKAHEPKNWRMVFDATRDDIPVEQGSYRLEIIPTYGRRTVVKGQFPYGKD